MKTPSNAEQVRHIVEDRVREQERLNTPKETVTIEWRGQQMYLPVISMPVDLLHFNPDTHRIRAQRSLDPVREKDLESDPFGQSAQSYLHQLLSADPTDPTKIDPSFTALKEDLKDHGQNQPGIITRAGVLINGNTRQAALKELGEKYIRVGVLPPDAAYGDLEAVELSLQLRKDHKRDYSFMNFLLAIEERANAGELDKNIQDEFHIKASTYERSRWVLSFVREAIERSRVSRADGKSSALRLVDFETHQGKLEELYRAYIALKAKSPDEAEMLREQRLFAMILDKSKTDLRLIEPDFVERYMKGVLPETTASQKTSVKIPGTSISVPGPSAQVQAVRELSTTILRAKSVAAAGGPDDEITKAKKVIESFERSLEKALDHAGKQGRVVKRRFAPADRISDACDDLNLAVQAVAEARSTGNFDPSDLDEILLTLKSSLTKLNAIVSRGSEVQSEGLTWIRAVGELSS